MQQKEFLTVSGEFGQDGHLRVRNRHEFQELEDKATKQAVEDYIDTLFDAVSETISETIDKLPGLWGINKEQKLKLQGQIATVGIMRSYANYLKDEREKSGKTSWQATKIAAAQTVSSWITARAFVGVAGVALGAISASPAVCIAGALVAGSVAITMFDDVKFFGDETEKKSAKDVLADMLRGKPTPKVNSQNTDKIIEPTPLTTEQSITSDTNIADDDISTDADSFEDLDPRCKNEKQILELLKSTLRNYVQSDDLFLDQSFTFEFHKVSTEEERFKRKANILLYEEFNLAIDIGCVSTARILLTKFGVIVDNSEEKYWNSLYRAVSRHQVPMFPMIKLLINHGANISVIQHPPLITRAVNWREADLTKLLLQDKNVALNYNDNDNPLYNAVSTENFNITELLLKAGADPNIHIYPTNCTVGYWSRSELCFHTILDKAIDVKNLNVTRLLLEHGANTNTPAIRPDSVLGIYTESYNLYPLQRAIDMKDIHLAGLLLSYDADPNISTPYPEYEEEYFNLLYSAVYEKSVELVDLLLKYGANPNGNSKHPNPIKTAIEQQNFVIMKIILDYSTQRKTTKTPSVLTDENVLRAVLYATNTNSTEAVSLMLLYYNTLELNNVMGNCAVVSAVRYGNIAITEDLILHGSNVSAGCNDTWLEFPSSANTYNARGGGRILNSQGTKETDEREFALQVATRKRHAEIVKLLILNNVNVDSVDFHQDTALSIAVKHSFHDIAQLLLKNGATINYIKVIPEEETQHYGDISTCFRADLDKSGLLQIAVNNNDYEMAKLLLTCGADYSLKSARGWSPIIAAAFRRRSCGRDSHPNYNISNLLIEYMADPCSEFHGITLMQLVISDVHQQKQDLGYFESMMAADASKASETWRAELIKSYQEFVEKQGLDVTRDGYKRSISEPLNFFKLLMSKGCDVNKYNEEYNNLTREYGHSTLELAVILKDLEIIELLLNAGANPNIPGAPRYSLFYSGIKTLDADVLYKLLSYGAYPNISDLPEIGSYDLKEMQLDKIIKNLRVLFQFGANPVNFINDVRYWVGCHEKDADCFSYKKTFKDSIQNLATKYEEINLTPPLATNSNDIIRLTKPGYYWGLDGNDTFVIHVLSQTSINRLFQLDDKDLPLEELKNHHLVIMDFAQNNPDEKVDVSEVPSIKSYSQITLRDIVLHSRPSLSIMANVNGELFEVVALCGTTTASFGEGNLVFG